MAYRNYNPLSFPRMYFFIVYFYVYFRVSFALTFTNEPASQDVNQGGQANFHCSVDDPDSAEITWTLDGNTISDTSRRYVDGEYLTIKEVLRNADAGYFACEAKDTNTGKVIKSAPAVLNIKYSVCYLGAFHCTMTVGRRT
ncbi:inactive tyrosine-protein kinase 7-like isoform X2 [Anneissia japonica]|uniref:inactive tyrosine-protein kinase 7-like isoform X2 n=1 Tax=Anneissia japonica TaxID=1529436 RepID=UPI0014257410|nr:inactive tyrosine-protein kinase 7-like isoform X2 [Anneissia japonica]